MTRFILAFLGLVLSAQLMGQSLAVSLEEAIQIAVDSSYATRDAEFNLLKKEREVQEVIAIGLPQVNAQAQFQNFLEIPTQLIPSEQLGQEPGEFIEAQFGVNYNLNGSIQATQLIFDGTYFIGLQAAKTVVEFSRIQKSKAVQDIKLATADAYYTTLLAQANFDILTENVANLDKTLEETRALYENGLTEEQDVDQLELNRNKLIISRDNTERILIISRQALLYIMGLPISTEITLTDDIESLVVLNNSPEYLEQEPDLYNHPDYLLAKTNLSLADLQIRGDKATFYPSLNGFVSYQQLGQSNEFNFFDSSADNFFPTSVWGLTLNVPIFSGFQRKRQLQQSQIAYEQSEMQLRQAEDGLRLEIVQARSNYEAALKNWENQKRSFELAQRISKKTTIKYSEGVADSFELNISENQLLQEQTRYIQTALELLNAKKALDKALNTL
ncbi:TolC family protein [Cryomorphaceae bacterium 1068]|nr:TolC family protein [Cryomorphaceae bacterium 1068]